VARTPTFRSSLAEHLEIARKLRGLRIRFDAAKCTGVLECLAVCPVDCWTFDPDRRKAIFSFPERCIACGACVLQCPEGAIALK